MTVNLKGFICLVTGGSRGIGKGIALGLGECGATVYITGRSGKSSSSSVGGSLDETAKEIDERGGVGIPVVVDHSDDKQVADLFDRISRDHDGRLDVLVNNAFAAVNFLVENSGTPFHRLPDPSQAWDIVNAVGLRNHFLCCWHGARLMTAADKRPTGKPGLIVNVSSIGGQMYLFNVAYGSGKAAVDRMTRDMAIELNKAKEDIAVISLWPGAVKTEEVMHAYSEGKILPFNLDLCESPVLSGRVVASLLDEPRSELVARSGSVVMTGDVAYDKGLLQPDGTTPPPSPRSARFALMYYKWRIAPLIPLWFRMPEWMFQAVIKRRR